MKVSLKQETPQTNHTILKNPTWSLYFITAAEHFTSWDQIDVRGNASYTDNKVICINNLNPTTLGNNHIDISSIACSSQMNFTSLLFQTEEYQMHYLDSHFSLQLFFSAIENGNKWAFNGDIIPLLWFKRIKNKPSWTPKVVYSSIWLHLPYT